MIESIHQVFPNVSRNQIRLDLDSAQKLLASETGTITNSASLSDVATNFGWNLPSGFVKLLDFVMYDEAGNPIYPDAENYKWEVEFNKFYVYTTESIPITGLNCASAYIHYEGLPTTLTAESTELQVTEQYRDALESYVLSKYFAKFLTPTIIQGQAMMALNLQAAKYQENIYEKLRIKLKREFNSREKTDDHSINYNYPGKFYLPKRPYSSGTGSTTTPAVTLTALSSLYTKYAYYKFVSGGSETDAIISLGYTGLGASLVGDVLTLTSTSDFDEETIIVPNNWDATWVMNSSSEIVFTLPSGWTTFSFEIYERD
jgi:hypothetical protein